ISLLDIFDDFKQRKDIYDALISFEEPACTAPLRTWAQKKRKNLSKEDITAINKVLKEFNESPLDKA
ncbi:MAG: hypothetical protein AB1489_13905, partial [Acidobacteriota bacterium]